MKWKYPLPRRRNFQEWYKWFAWRPVRINNTTEIVWLEWVERREMFDTTIDAMWNEYRKLK